MKTIAIIGGGFSGTLVAVNLARLGESAFRVALVNRGRPLARGIAYSTKRPEHLLNVVARNMSALADHPDHFLDWLRTRHEFADLAESSLREAFIPRRVYGDYLRSLLQTYAQPVHGSAQARIELIDDEAVDAQVAEDGAAMVVLAQGDIVAADRIVLATGNAAPAAFATADGAAFEHPRYAPLPWDDWETRLPGRHEDIVLLGAGLTTVDAFLTLSALDWQGTIFAVSRNGWLPQSHFRGIEYPGFPPQDPTTVGLAQLVAMLESHCERLRNLGANPAIVVDKLRAHTQRIWQSFSLEERREFLARYAARWNVSRHRIPSEIHRRLTTAIEDRRVQIVKGRIIGLEPSGSRIRVVVADDSGARLHLEGGFVVNCTGPNASFSQSAGPLYRNLLARGVVACDELDMGLRVNADLIPLDQRGAPSQFLSALGPPLRGALWETTAVPELRAQAFQIAKRLITELELAGRGLEHWPAQADFELLEYCI